MAGLSDKQLQAIDYLVMGHTQRETAAAVGVQESTLSRWVRTNAAFQDELAERRAALAELRKGRILGVLDKALDVMVAALDAKDERIRFRAASTLLTPFLQAQAKQPKRPARRAARREPLTDEELVEILGTINAG